MHDHDHDPMNMPEPDLSAGIATDEVLNSKSATLFAVVLLVLCVVVIIISIGFVKWWGPKDEAPMASQDVINQRTTDMPAPLLQADPGKEMSQFSVTQTQTMHNYGWVNKEKGVVRIPIEQAIEITAQRGLPAREEGHR